jgi:parvulin-like peptidyl-prolyl isomerase
MTLALLLQISSLVQPLHLAPEPPELRAARNVLLVYAETEEGPARPRLPADETFALAQSIVARARAGEPVTDLAERYSHDPNAAFGAVMGVFGPRMLPHDLDAFLFSAEMGEVSEPLLVAGGVAVLQRVEARVGARQIFVAGLDAAARARMGEVRDRLGRGEPFPEIARELSQDAESAARGGLIGAFERGRQDRLLKRAAFEAGPDEVVGPIESPLGLHLLQRVPLDDVPPELVESGWIRVRAILIVSELSQGADPLTARPEVEAERLARELHERLLAGEDMAELARRFDDDPGGRERAGDLGWVHRKAPGLPRFAQRWFPAPVGVVQEPLPTERGWLLFRRER